MTGALIAVVLSVSTSLVPTETGVNARMSNFSNPRRTSDIMPRESPPSPSRNTVTSSITAPSTSRTGATK
jgi:hypothetical protein